MDSSDANPDSSEERLSSEEDPVDDPKDADFEVPDDDDEEEEEDEFMEEDEAPPRRRRSLPRGQPDEEEDAPPRRRRSATKLNEDEVDESTEEPPPRRRSATKLAEDEEAVEATARPRRAASRRPVRPLWVVRGPRARCCGRLESEVIITRLAQPRRGREA